MCHVHDFKLTTIYMHFCNTLQFYLDFRILTVCNHRHVLGGEGFLNEHWITNTNKWIILQFFIYYRQTKKNKKRISVLVSIHFWIQFNFHTKNCNNIGKKQDPFLMRNSISTCKSTDKIVQFVRVSTFHPPSKNRKTKKGRIYTTHKHHNI